MNTKERYKNFTNFLLEAPLPRTTELVYHTPFQLLMAVILSAQCTDQRVNLCTPALFAAFPTAEDLAKASFDQIFYYIKSISYPKNKTKFILGTAQKLITEFQGIIPKSAEKLQTLPGVGRKTAHVILSILYNQPKMAVDTHVFRVSKRIGLACPQANTPLKVEKALMKNLSIDHVQIANQWLLLHGRHICLARKPLCQQCPITRFCNFFQKHKNTLTKHT